MLGMHTALIWCGFVTQVKEDNKGKGWPRVEGVGGHQRCGVGGANWEEV
jgi:hypothetical protein